MPLDRPWRRSAAVFLACALSLAWFGRRPWNPNENSRMALALAALRDGTLAIDAYHASGPVQTTDRSERGGHAYSDKAPGSSLLAAAGYAPVLAWERAAGRDAPYVIRKYAMTVAAVGLPLAAALCALFTLAAGAVGPRAAAAAAGAGLLGTPLLPFGSALFGHALAGALLFLGFALARRAATTPGGPRRRDLAGVGALLGLCAATEYPAVPACLLVAAYGLLRLERQALRRPGTWLAPLAGAAPALALVALYDWRCFGAPWALGYANLADPYFRTLHAHGLLGVGPPRLEVAYYLTLHPARGLLAGAPILLLAVPGLWAMARERAWRAEAGLCAAVFLSFLAVNAGFGMWWGGFSYTARHLIPSVPFLVLPLAFLRPAWWWLGVPLLGLSAAQSLAAAFGDPFPNDGPLLAGLQEAGRRGRLLAWRGTWVGEQLWPALAVRGRDGGWPGFAPNLGALLGLRGPASALPLLAAVGALLWSAARPGPSPVRAGGGAAHIVSGSPDRRHE